MHGWRTSNRKEKMKRKEKNRGNNISKKKGKKEKKGGYTFMGYEHVQKKTIIIS